ncbi:MAG: hypothetical protein Salg2KO_22080 [Salibacteraceae bacterium]
MKQSQHLNPIEGRIHQEAGNGTMFSFTEGMMKAIEKLNDLLSRNYDAEEGFKLAADKVEDSVLEEYFNRNRVMHRKFGHDIKNQIAALKGEINKGTSFEGDLHRTWLNFKAAMANNTDEALLEECARGQEIAMKDYQKAIEELAHPEVTSMLAKQKAEIVDIVHELKALEVSAQ